MYKVEVDLEDLLRTINFLFLIKTYDKLPDHVRNLSLQYALLWQSIIVNSLSAPAGAPSIQDQKASTPDPGGSITSSPDTD